MQEFVHRLKGLRRASGVSVKKMSATRLVVSENAQAAAGVAIAVPLLGNAMPHH